MKNYELNIQIKDNEQNVINNLVIQETNQKDLIKKLNAVTFLLKKRTQNEMIFLIDFLKRKPETIEDLVSAMDFQERKKQLVQNEILFGLIKRMIDANKDSNEKKPHHKKLKT